MPRHYPDAVYEVVERWRARLCPDWRVILMDHPPDEDTEDGPSGSLGQCQTDVGERFNRIWLNLPAIEKERQGRYCLEETIVHELLHGVVDTVEDIYQFELGASARMAVSQRAREAREQAIERLAVLLVALDHGTAVRMVHDGRPKDHAS